MAEKKFDPTKPVQTRDGLPARIICTDAAGSYPIVVLINQGAFELLVRRTADGKWSVTNDAPHPRDLINITEHHVLWVNVYPGGIGNAHPTRELADRAGYRDRIACVRVEFEEGEGL